MISAGVGAGAVFLLSVVVVATAAPQDSGVLVGIRSVCHRYVMYMSMRFLKVLVAYINQYIHDYICSHIYTVYTRL